MAEARGVWLEEVYTWTLFMVGWLHVALALFRGYTWEDVILMAVAVVPPFGGFPTVASGDVRQLEGRSCARRLDDYLLGSEDVEPLRALLESTDERVPVHVNNGRTTDENVFLDLCGQSDRATHRKAPNGVNAAFQLHHQSA